MKGRKPKSKYTTREIINDESPPGTLESTIPPDWFSEMAVNIWCHTLRDIEAAGHAIPDHSREIFIGYCLSAAAAREADEVLQREGMVTKDEKGGTRKHPLISVRSQALLQLRSYGESLGLSPSSAARLPLPPAEPERNHFADL